MLPEFFKFFLPTKAIYGIGLVEKLSAEVKFFGQKRALVLTDSVLVKLGHIKKLEEGLKDSKIEIGAVYSDIPPNSTIKTVEEAARIGKEKGCDLIIAIGGGSVMDTAKVTNVLMFKGGKVQDHMGAQLLDQKILPSIFIPTTAGTGSEITQYAMISDPENDVKLPFSEEYFLPDLAVLDPEMTKAMPAKLTAATGMDALTHAVESFVSNQDNPISDALALAAIEMIGANLLQSCAVPDDLEARGAMLVASFIAGAAFNFKGVGVVHGVSHALGGVYHIPHGVANSIILPLGVEFNLDVVEAKFARISETLGEVGLSPVQELSKRVSKLDISMLNQALDQLSFVDEWLMKQRARQLVIKIRTLNQQLASISGFPLTLKEAGVKDGMAKLDQLIATAMEDGSMLYNPRKVTADDVRAILITAHNQQLEPIPVTRSDFKAARGRVIKKKLKNIFKTEQDVYDTLLNFFFLIRDTDSMSRDLAASKLSVRFNYRNPESSIAIDASGADIKIVSGGDAQKLNPAVEMNMEADFAHYFWHGEVNILQALARNEVTTKGNVPKALKLLPILEPAYTMYPNFLRDNGKAAIVVN